MKIHHICIQTDKYKESMEFYTKVMGFRIEKETKDFHGREYNTWLELNGFYIELQTPKKGEKLLEWNKNNGGPVHICFMADDVYEELRKIEETGYDSFKYKNGEKVYKVEDGHLFKVKAPEGTEIEIRDTQI